jgi:hypothetical protein
MVLGIQIVSAARGMGAEARALPVMGTGARADPEAAGSGVSGGKARIGLSCAAHQVCS